MPPIRLVIIEDQYLVRDALARLMAKEPDIEVVAAADDGQTGVSLTERLQGHIVRAADGPTGTLGHASHPNL
ncbi:MAG: hypothetical protein M0Z36_03405 [Thermaerobacter sp.]|nr:hypothetical protein [Thermaerobacter sp.]